MGFEWGKTFINTVDDKDTDLTARIKNVYDVLDTVEQKRLATQLALMRKADVQNIRKCINGKQQVNILDVGCNNGMWLHDRLRYCNVTGNVVGVEIEPAMEQVVANNFPAMVFVNADIESETFLDVLHQKVPTDVQFDLITVSMVLLHIKNVEVVLRNLYKLLKPDGYIYIRDMDDTLTVSYPDEDSLVKRMLAISDSVKYTGNRHSGGEIYTQLKRAGFTRIEVRPDNVDITSKLNGLSEYDIREALFVINFQYVRGDLQLAYADNPQKYADDYNWMQRNYEKLRKKMHETDYYYRMGTFVCIAQK